MGQEYKKMARKKTSYKKPKAAPKRRVSTSSKNAVAKRKNRLFLPYPLLGFLLLAVGVLLVGLTFKSSADTGSYTVKGKIAAPLPTAPAVITNFAANSHTRLTPITVSGTCPTNYPENYISINRNGVYSGTVLCNTNNTFSIGTDLLPGANELQAQIYNRTDDAGPVSDPVTIFYDPPPPTLPKDQSFVAVPPLLLKTDFSYRAYLVGQKVTWELEIDGGIAPYAVNVDWGDGKTSLVSLKGEGKFTIEHTYTEQGGFSNSYPIIVKATDVGQRSAYLQFFIRVNPFNSPLGSGSTSDKGGTPAKVSTSPVSPQLLKMVWPAYGIVLLMTVSFWLGEQEEFLGLRKKGAVKKRFS